MRKLPIMVNKVTPYAWDNSVTVYEMLGKLLNKINEVVDEVNLKLPDDFETAFYEKFREYTREEMQRLIDSGEFAAILDSMIGDFSPIKQEVIDARDGEVSVGAKIRSVDAQLERIGVDVKNYGAVGDGIVDDTIALQNAINYAAALEVSTNRKVNLGHKEYVVSGLNIPSGVHLYGRSILKVTGTNGYGVKLENSLYSIIEGFKILLTASGQTGVIYDSVEGATHSQLNTMKNVWIEGDDIPGTTALELGLTYVNSFYDCKFFRCETGVKFTNFDSNANMFYGCEIRGVHNSPNSGFAIEHIDGKNNAFKGGTIETTYGAVDIKSGTLELDGVYTESFQLDKAFKMYGGSLTVRNSLLKSKFEISGGEILRIENNDMTKGGIYTNIGSPLVTFKADVLTKVICQGNTFPADMIHAQWGMYLDGSFVKRSPQNLNEKYLDRNMPTLGIVSGASNITGDDTVYDVLLGSPIVNTNDELDTLTGIYTPKSNGLYRCKISLELENITDQSSANLFVRERGVEAKEYLLDQVSMSTKNSSNRVLLKGEAIIPVQVGMGFNFTVTVYGTTKTVRIRETISKSVRGWYEIERIA